MTLTNLSKTPWPWFGGKADAAEHVWAALGDVVHYVEPFAGSLAVLLRRPHPCNRTYYSETVNDADGLLVNAWRSIQMSPDATAEAASWPVTEADLHARHLALVKWRADRELEHLMGDPQWHDPVMAGWWMWGQSSWIGSGWCSGRGPWVVGADGRITKSDMGSGVRRQIPHLKGNVQGANHPNTREPGVARQIPHLSGAGQGANHPHTREPGVGDFHPMTMPDLRRWFAFLSARLRHVRVLNGDWSRACTRSRVCNLSVANGTAAGVFLDPPYAPTERTGDLYAVDSGTVAADVRAWCAENGNDPKIRIVLAGYDTEHAELEARGWRVVEWFRAGFLKGGMGNQRGAAATQQHRERLWLSPHCLGAREERQVALFGGAA